MADSYLDQLKARNLADDKELELQVRSNKDPETPPDPKPDDKSIVIGIILGICIGGILGLFTGFLILGTIVGGILCYYVAVLIKKRNNPRDNLKGYSGGNGN